MAEVYRAYHPRLDRYVAIKVLHAFLAEDDEFRVRFEKEARNIAKLSHNNIVQVYDFDYAEERDSYYMVMELIDGETLKDRIHDLATRDEKLPLDEVLRIVREAASALAYAHSRGMIHRDVKPANLMIDQDNRLVLTDFGIAKMLNAKQATVSGGMIGTPAYMAPEQGLGEPGDERSDLYSLGIIMYQLLTGDLPYDAETALGIILMHVNDPVPDLRAINPDVPEAVQDVVRKAMAKDPERRYQSAEELIADISRVERGEAVTPLDGDDSPFERVTQETRAIISPPIDQPKSPTEPKRPVPETSTSGGGGRWGAIIALLLVLFAGGGYWFGATSGFLPVVAFLASPTPTLTPTTTHTPTATLTLTATHTPTLTVTPSITPTPTLTVTPTDTPTATATFTATPTPSLTPTNTPTATETPVGSPTPTNTPSPTPNPSQTAAAIQTATIAACTFDYAVVEQTPADGEEGGFFPVNQPYLREIELLNTGTCEWGENTSLTFVEGEDFNAGPRIFIRESLQVGETTTLTFEGTTPGRGNATEPQSGRWQLRTRGQKAIGAPLTIGVMVFDPGTGG